MSNNKYNLLKEVSLKLIIVSVLFLASTIVFVMLAHEVVLEREDLFDSSVFNFFKVYSSPQFIKAMKAITFFGSSYFFVPAYSMLVIYLLAKSRRRDALDVSIIGIISTILLHGLKYFFQRNRPDLPLLKTLNNYSFPSGHALSSFIFCSVLVFLTWKTKWSISMKWLLSILLLLFSLSIGISRIVLRYHFASDVLAGFCLGLAFALLSLWAQKKLRRKTAI